MVFVGFQLYPTPTCLGLKGFVDVDVNVVEHLSPNFPISVLPFSGHQVRTVIGAIYSSREKKILLFFHNDLNMNKVNSSILYKSPNSYLANFS